MTITFYKATRPSSATPIQWALTELEVPHETIALDIDIDNAQRTPEFLRIDPNGRVPTLVVDGTPIFEGLAIIQWLGDSFGVDKGLWPSPEDPARLRALSWSAWAYVTFGAVTHTLQHVVGADEALRARAVDRMAGLLEILDAELATRAFVVGDTFSLADVALGSVVAYASFSEMPKSIPANVQAWLGRLQARPAFAAAWGG